MIKISMHLIHLKLTCIKKTNTFQKHNSQAQLQLEKH